MVRLHHQLVRLTLLVLVAVAIAIACAGWGWDGAPEVDMAPSDDAALVQ